MKESKVVSSLREAIRLSGLQDGMCVSFHHHLRNGDYVVNMVMEQISAMGIRDLTVNASALFDVHLPMLEHIKNGTVSRLLTNYMSAGLGRAISGASWTSPWSSGRTAAARAILQAAKPQSTLHSSPRQAATRWATARARSENRPAVRWATPSRTRSTRKKVIVITDELGAVSALRLVDPGNLRGLCRRRGRHR